jgi:hypothetical protein
LGFLKNTWKYLIQRPTFKPLYFYNVFFKILENTSFWAPSKNTRISYVTTMPHLPLLAFKKTSNNLSHKQKTIWRSKLLLFFQQLLLMIMSNKVWNWAWFCWIKINF